MKLQLDYVRDPYALPAWVWLLLACSLIALAACIWFYFEQQAVRDGLALKLESRAMAVTPSRRPVLSAEQQVALDASAKSAGSVMHELGRPWPAVLERLESSHGQGIALLSVNIDGARNMLRIGGEARHLVDVLDYVHRLSTDTFLSEVVLEKHEVVENDPLKPVRFSLSIRWGSA